MKKILISIISILVLISAFFTSILLFSNGNLKYSEEIEINKPLDFVSDMFDNIYNMKKYLPNTKDIILISGNDGQVGAEYKLIIDMGGEEYMEMSALLKDKNLPDSITYLYHTRGVVNVVTQKNYETLIGNTIVVNQQEFHFTGIPKIIWFFNPSGFSL